VFFIIAALLQPESLARCNAEKAKRSSGRYALQARRANSHSPGQRLIAAVHLIKDLAVAYGDQAQVFAKASPPPDFA